MKMRRGSVKEKHILYSQRCWIDGSLQAATLFIEGGKIARIVGGKEPAPDRVDYGDAVLMPGLIDPHVHINEPGRTHWEGFDTATRAAAFGGITTLIDMPLNSSPVTTTGAAFWEKIQASEGKRHVHCGFWGGVVDENKQHVQELIDAGCLGFKAFLTHSGIADFPNATPAQLDAVMPRIAAAGLPLLVHCELALDPDSDRALQQHSRSYAAWLASRPDRWEVAAIETLIDLCKKHRCRTHIVHLATAAALPLIRAAKREGLPLTVETCPHYLFWAAEDIPDGDTRYKCAPPIRDAANRDALRAAIGEGLIDFIGSDHSPAPPEIKELDSGNLAKAWGGIAGLQFLLPASWTSLSDRIGLAQFIPLVTENPARFVGLAHRKGKIAPGYDADLVVWEPESAFDVQENEVQHRHKVSPYVGETLKGRVLHTWVSGREVYGRDRFFSEHAGDVLRH